MRKTLWALVLVASCRLPAGDATVPRALPMSGGTLETHPGEQTVAPFQLEPRQVTVARYSQCVRSGACSDKIGLGNKEDGWCETPLPGCQRRKQKRCNYNHRDRGDAPMNCVAREDAQVFCAWEGRRLPTDEELWWSFSQGDPPPAARPDRLPGELVAAPGFIWPEHGQYVGARSPHVGFRCAG